MGAIVFSRHPRSGIEIGSGKKDGKFDWKTRLLVNGLNLNNTGWEDSAMILRWSYISHAKFYTDFETFLLCLTC